MQDVEIIRLSEKQKQQLIILKRKTGIENWNVLCRWALCISLADLTVPPKEDIPSDSNVEMTWKTFAGHEHQVYASILRLRHKEQLPFVHPVDFIKIHLSRGVNYLLKSSPM